MNTNTETQTTTKTSSLITQLLIAIAILTAVVLFPVLSSLNESRAEQERSEQLAKLNQLSDELSEAISHQAIERGSGNTMIAAAGRPSDAIVDINLLNRGRGDSRVETALGLAEALEAELGDTDFSNAVANWQAAYKALVNARPRIKERSITSGEWLGFANANIDAEKALIAVAFSPRDEAEKATFYNAIVRDSATDIIHYLGQQRAVYGATLSSQAPITEVNAGRLSILEARVASAVEKLGEIQNLESTPIAISDKIRAFRSRFTGSFADFVDSIREQSQAALAVKVPVAVVEEVVEAPAVEAEIVEGAEVLAEVATEAPEEQIAEVVEEEDAPVYRQTPAEWFGEAGATIKLASDLSLLAGEQSAGSTATVLAQAEKEFTYSVAGLVLVVLVLGGVFYWFRSSIIQKVSSLSKVSQQVAEGNFDVRAEVSASNEIGLLTSNFNKMVGSLVDAERASEERREEAEKERQALQAGIQDLLMATSDGSDGDLTVRAPVTDGTLGNVADAFNLMAEELGDAIAGIKNSASEVASRAGQINESTSRMRDGATKQTEEIMNARSAVEEMAAKIEAVANNATRAAEAAKTAQMQAETGQQAVSEVISGMDRIRGDVQSSAKKIKQLGESTMEISSIVGTIQDISEQTNMLALNAAIEAARAGEHGRGFTVVAEEVRKLAERAAAATSEIEELISGIQAETNQSVESMELQIGNVENETIVVSRAGASLSEIAQSSIYSSELIEQISESAKEQVAGANSVVDTMQLISKISEDALETADTNKESTEYLDQKANSLLETTGRFKT